MVKRLKSYHWVWLALLAKMGVDVLKELWRKRQEKMEPKKSDPP